MIDILYGATNRGKTSLATRWRPNAIIFGLESATVPQLRRVLGIQPRFVSAWAHKQSPKPGISHASLYKLVHGGEANDGSVIPGGQKFGFVALMSLIELNYGTLKAVHDQRVAARGQWPSWPSFDLNAAMDQATANFGVDASTVGLWQITGQPRSTGGGWHIDRPVVNFSTDVIFDDVQFLCRNAVDAHFRAPSDLMDETTPLATEVMGNALKYKNEIGKQSARWMRVMFDQLQRMDAVNWTITTHRRAAGSADMGEKGTIVYGGGPEFFTGGQIDVITGYVNNSLMLRPEEVSDEEREAMPWLVSPMNSADGFHTWASHLPEDHPLAAQYQTKQRGPFWAESPSGIHGLYRGSGQPCPADMQGFEWLNLVVEAMLDAVPENPSGLTMKAWDELWAEMSTAGRAAFKAAREADIRLALMNREDQAKAKTNTRPTGCSYVGLSRLDLGAQLSWALHEGYAAWVARRRRAEALGADDLFNLGQPG